MITLIAAIGRNNEIGFENKLLWNIPGDMKHFKSYTMNKVIIMGSNTFTSMGSKSLPGRKSIVVTSQGLNCVSAIRAPNIQQALSVEHCYNELVVIGGASIYNQTINLADKLVITHIDAEFTADAFFPEIDLTKWQITSRIDLGDEKYHCEIIEYSKITPAA